MFTFTIKQIKKISYYFAEHCFGVFIVLLFCAIVCGGFIFYEYSKHPKNQGIEDSGALLEFDGKVYQEILQTWEEQGQKIEQSESKQYPLLFQTESVEFIESTEFY